MAWQGKVDPGAAADVAGALYEMGCYEVSMGDTIGIGTPATVTAMLQACPIVSRTGVNTTAGWSLARNAGSTFPVSCKGGRAACFMRALAATGSHQRATRPRTCHFLPGPDLPCDGVLS